MAIPSKKQIESLATTIIEVEISFQIWEAFKIAQTKVTTIKPINKYNMFFLPTQLAHFNTIIINSYRLFETRKDTINFKTIKDLSNHEFGINFESDSKFEDLYQLAHKLWPKFSLLRNKCIGHLSHEATQEEIFKNAGLSPEDIRNFIKHCQNLYWRVPSSPGDSSLILGQAQVG
jgi:hypothetical protein